MAIDKYIETIIHYASAGSYKAEVLEAREAFFKTIGVVSDQEDRYEEKLRNFLDWYIFDRPLSDTGKPPVESFYDKFHRTFSQEDEAVYDGFCNTFESLFLVKKSDENGVWIKDLITRRKYFVEDEVPEGFYKDEMFQVRLIPYRGGFRFGEAFCFHPLAANKLIMQMVKKLDKEDSDSVRAFLDDLTRRRRASERYRHVDAVQFYLE